MTQLFRKVAMLVALAAIPALISALIFWKTGKWDSFQDHTVLLSEISQWKVPVLWVDARSASDFEAAHVSGAVRLTEEDWNELLPGLLKQWEPNCAVVVYCSSQKCHASEEVARRLREEVGLKLVYSFRGGWESWKGSQQ